MAKVKSKKLDMQRRTILSLLALLALSIAALYTVRLLSKRETVTSTPTEAAASKCAADFKVLGSCNGECKLDSDCSSGYKCISAACRNADNPTNERCQPVQKIGEFTWNSPTLYDTTSSGGQNLNTQKVLDLMSNTDRVKITVSKLESSSQDQLKDERATWKFTFNNPTGEKTFTCDKEEVSYECGSFTYDTTGSNFRVDGHHLGSITGTPGSHEVRVKVEMYSF
jgi:hypothetical protein